jgi:hypothetical protein
VIASATNATAIQATRATNSLCLTLASGCLDSAPAATRRRVRVASYLSPPLLDRRSRRLGPSRPLALQRRLLRSSSHRTLGLVTLPFLSRHHSTAPPSLKRYEEDAFKSFPAPLCLAPLVLRRCGHRLDQRHLHPWLCPLRLTQHRGNVQSGACAQRTPSCRADQLRRHLLQHAPPRLSPKPPITSPP